MATLTRGAKLAKELRQMQKQQCPAPTLLDSDDASASSAGSDDYDPEAFQRLANRIMNRMHPPAKSFAHRTNIRQRVNPNVSH